MEFVGIGIFLALLFIYFFFIRKKKEEPVTDIGLPVDAVILSADDDDRMTKGRETLARAVPVQPSPVIDKPVGHAPRVRESSVPRQRPTPRRTAVRRSLSRPVTRLRPRESSPYFNNSYETYFDAYGRPYRYYDNGRVLDHNGDIMTPLMLYWLLSESDRDRMETPVGFYDGMSREEMAMASQVELYRIAEEDHLDLDVDGIPYDEEEEDYAEDDEPVDEPEEDEPVFDDLEEVYEEPKEEPEAEDEPEEDDSSDDDD